MDESDSFIPWSTPTRNAREEKSSPLQAKKVPLKNVAAKTAKAGYSKNIPSSESDSEAANNRAGISEGVLSEEDGD